MKKIRPFNNVSLALAATVCIAASVACSTPNDIDVIPYPQEVSLRGGYVATLLSDTVICELACGTLHNAGKYGIRIDLLDTIEGVPSPEGYILDISPSGVMITASDSAGVFYAYQTLRQLLSGKKLPDVRIVDYPRFTYRGMHFDVSRHFRDKHFIMKQLDAMAYYKLNTFHWHLTDGAGWRLEIERYPALTEIAAFRPYDGWKQWWNGGRKYCTEDTPGAEGGYYTKEDVREVIAYAKKRNINIIPEIEMPGHSEEVLAVYPELSCTGQAYTSSEFCIGNEKTFEFLENVLDEVIELFPSEYIHIGGDEASREHWKACSKCRRRMEEEHLENEDQLQSYFVHRIEEYIHSRGRRMIGWDEIMLGGVTPSAVVMAWRGMDWGIRAAEGGNDVVMTPGEFCYFDAYQDAPHTQPEAIGGYLTLQKVYSFEPVPDTLSLQVAGHFKGVQANVWCEYIPTASHAEYMIYPRLLALAEVAWSSPRDKDWERFRNTVVRHTDILRSNGYNPFDIRQELGERPEARQPLEHLAVGCPITYLQNFSRYYPAGGDSALVDGVRGGWTYGDKRWQGFINRDVDVIIDLGQVRNLTYVGAEFMQLTGPYLWQPEEVVISLSEDGENYTEMARMNTDVPRDASELIFRTYAWEGASRGRYVRYNAIANDIPNGCLFVDEIVVR